MDEIWKDIPNYEGYYEVSNLGNFRSKDRIIHYRDTKYRKYPGKCLLTETTKDNYQRIVLMKNGIKTRYTCHRLVASAFIPNIHNKPCVNHIDGNKSNNNVSNLEWVTYSENTIHAFNTGLVKKHYINSTNIKIKCIETNQDFISIKEASKILDIDYSYLWRCVHEHKVCKKYHFIVI